MPRDHECLAYTEVTRDGQPWKVDCARETGKRGRHFGPHRDAAGRWFIAQGHWPDTEAQVVTDDRRR